MKKHITLIFFLLTAFSFSSQAQEVDMKIAEVINSEKWSELRSYYEEHKSEIQSPVIDLTSKMFISYAYNRPQQCIDAGMKLMVEHSAELGESIFSVHYLVVKSMIQTERYEESVALANSMYEALRAAGDTVSDNYTLVNYLRRYSEYCRKIGGEMLYIPSGRDEVLRFKGNSSILLDGTINGQETEMLFDTGAGANIIMRNYAEKLGLKPIEGLNSTVAGIGRADVDQVFVDSLTLGGMVFRNVPFMIVDADTGHEKADSMLLKLKPVIGQSFIRKFGEVQVDFCDSTFTVPAQLTSMPFDESNINYNLTGTWDFAIKVGGDYVYLNFDTGAWDLSLNCNFYKQFKDYVDAVGRVDSLRVGGVGGWYKTETRVIPDFHYFMVDGREFVADSVHVSTEKDMSEKRYGMFGVDAMSKSRKMIINVKDMFIDFIPYIDKPDLGEGKKSKDVVIRLNGKPDLGENYKEGMIQSAGLLTGPTIENRFVNRGGHVQAETLWQ